MFSFVNSDVRTLLTCGGSGLLEAQPIYHTWTLFACSGILRHIVLKRAEVPLTSRIRKVTFLCIPYSMGCASSNPAFRDQSGRASHADFEQPDPDPTAPLKTVLSYRRFSDASDSNPMTHSQEIRARRLSHIMFDEELRESKEVETIAVKLPTPIELTPEVFEVITSKNPRKRRASYLLVDTDPRLFIAEVAHASLAGLDDGHAKKNQDRFLVHMDETCCLFAVADGHGLAGHAVAAHIQTSMPTHFLNNLLSKTTEEASVDAIRDAENGVLKSGIDCSLSGSTVSVALVNEHRLFLTWVGDSLCFLLSRDQQGALGARLLNQPHNFEAERERTRVEAAGGRILRFEDPDDNFLGPYRVFLPDQPLPGLSMSRSVGDVVAKRAGVICEPEVAVTTLSEEDQYLVLCSDGVTEFMTKDEIASTVHSSIASLSEACEQIVREARRRWVEAENNSSDDITIVVVRFRPKKKTDERQD